MMELSARPFLRWKARNADSIVVSKVPVCASPGRRRTHRTLSPSAPGIMVLKRVHVHIAGCKAGKTGSVSLILVNPPVGGIAPGATARVVQSGLRSRRDGRDLS